MGSDREGKGEKEHKVSISKDAQVEKPPGEAEDGDTVVVAQLGSHPTAQLSLFL